jgi:hypothetical protein
LRPPLDHHRKRVSINGTVMPIARFAARKFDTYFSSGGRHSVAV